MDVILPGNMDCRLMHLLVTAIPTHHGSRVQGDASPLALLRLFGTDSTPRVKFYRDHAAWCPYCQRVWLLLEEKRIPYSGMQA